MRTFARRAPAAPSLQLARACLAGAFISMYLSGCGGGDSSLPAGELAASPSGGRIGAQAVSVAANGLMMDKEQGWYLAQAATPIVQGPTVVPAGRKVYHVEASYNSSLPAGTVRTGELNAPFDSPQQLMNSVAKFNPGDVILLKCGSAWRDQLIWTLDFTTPQLKGATGMLIGAYGPDCTSANLPNIRGSERARLEDITETVDALGRQIFKARLANALFVDELFNNSVPMMRARYPDQQGDWGSRYAIASSITALGAAPSFTEFKVADADRANIEAAMAKLGADPAKGSIYVRTQSFTVEKRSIAAYNKATGVVTLGNALRFPIREHMGYMLEASTGLSSDDWMVSKENEWGNVVINSQPYLYFYGAVPQALEFGRKAIGLQVIGAQNLQVDRLSFSHQQTSIMVINSTGMVISNVQSAYAGLNGIWATSGVDSKYQTASNATVDLQVLNSRIVGAGQYGIQAEGQDTRGVVVKNNLVLDTGRYNVAPFKNDLNTMQSGIRVEGIGAKVQDNYVLNAARNAIVFDDSDFVEVSNNTIVRPCLVLADCGAIYTRGRTFPVDPLKDDFVEPPLKRDDAKMAKVTGNVIAGVQANMDGFYYYGQRGNLRAGEYSGYGIYLDDYANNVLVSGNLITNVDSGIYLHNAMWNRIESNKIRGARHASFEVNDDYAKAELVEVVRGNRVVNNQLFSHHPADPAKLGVSDPVFPNNDEFFPNAQNKAVPVYAQLWQHRSNARNYFKDLNANISAGNRTLTLSRIEAPAVWRMGRNGQVEQASGAVWALKSKGDIYDVGVGLVEWLSFMGEPPTGSVKDSEESPVSYAPYQAVLDKSNNSLIKDFLRNEWAVFGGNVAYDVSACPSVPCIEFISTDRSNSLKSSSFPITDKQLYLADYTVTAGGEAAKHSANVFEDGVYKVDVAAGSYVQNTSFSPNQGKRIEHFFRAAKGASSVSLYLRPHDVVAPTSTPMLNKKAYFSRASLFPVTKVDAMPPLNTLSVSVVNAALADRVITCAELGLSDKCSLVVDEENKLLPGGTAVVLKPRTAMQLYVRDAQWFNGLRQ